MKPKIHFKEEEFERQQIFGGKHWSVVLPRKPISRFHLMVVIKDPTKETFVDLDDEDLLELKECIDRLLSATVKKFNESYDGYNLFSNNGSGRIGQHLNQFHQHIFLRFTNEGESPYATLAKGERWTDSTTSEWVSQRDFLRNMVQ